MAALTYQQAVKIFTKRAEQLETNLQTLTKNIDQFFRKTRKKAEKSQRKKERVMLKKLEKKLK